MRKVIILYLFAFSMLCACDLGPKQKINIIDAKIAAGIDEKLMPINITNLFPKGTEKVFCWFSWKSTQVNTEIIASWRYVTDDIAILDYTFTIPRKEGQGSVALKMPEGKTLPSGVYNVDLNLGKHTLKSLKFKIE